MKEIRMEINVLYIMFISILRDFLPEITHYSTSHEENQSILFLK